MPHFFRPVTLPRHKSSLPPLARLTARSSPLLLAVVLIASASQLPAAVLSRSDVVFMYQADPDIYQRYGATVLAWGGTPTPAALSAASGIKFFGSVGMVTE